jgi:hypothetical protein
LIIGLALSQLRAAGMLNRSPIRVNHRGFPDVVLLGEVAGIKL